MLENKDRIPESKDPEIKEWTVMFYLASDNSLASTMVSQLKALKDAGFHRDANVVAHFDPHVVNMPVHIFDINYLHKLETDEISKIGFYPDDPFDRNLVLDKLWGDHEPDLSIRTKVKERVEAKCRASNNGRPIRYEPPRPSKEMSEEQDPDKALRGFLDFCQKHYPARHYLLIVLGHGQVVGDDSFLYDDSAKIHSVSLKDLGTIISEFSAKIQSQKDPGELEMVGFHSCSMSSVEVAYELAGSTKYMLASQGPAYVGSWPYKQLLVGLFKTLDASGPAKSFVHNGNRTNDSLRSLLTKVREGKDPLSSFLREHLSEATQQRFNTAQEPDESLVEAVFSEIDETLNSAIVNKAPVLAKICSSSATAELINSTLDGGRKVRLKRLVLADAYPGEIARAPKVDLRDMVDKMFSYCFYNNFDFKLAGYSFDLCLTDLREVPETQAAIKRLAKSLIAALKLEEPGVKEAILLAHLDSQSFANEDYVDLYDFCCRLRQRWPWKKPLAVETRSSRTLKDVYDACEEVMDSLRQGSDKPVDGGADPLVVRSAFAGPAFQYSHGLSVFFPWAEPTTSRFWKREYSRSEFCKQTCWGKFLRKYFEETRRDTRVKERRKMGYPEERNDFDSSLSGEVLGLLDRITAEPASDSGQLVQKPGPDHPMGKWGPDDPTGMNSCECPTIKNYPRFTLDPAPVAEGKKRPGTNRKGYSQV